MTPSSEHTAVAIFGSAARGDLDLFSDRDLLIVSNDKVSLQEMKRRYESLGWSCTAYSWTRLQHAADQGALFVQHLKQESIIISDPSCQLADLLEQYSANVDYKRERAGAACMLGQVMQHLPRCEAGPMWALDVLSVGFRSLALTNLADEGIYVFSNSGIINGLSQIGMITNQSKEQLASLRRFKSLYRRRCSDTRTDWHEVFGQIQLIDSIFGLGLSSRCYGTIDMVELALSQGGDNVQTSANWYTKCRRLESALWTLTPRYDRYRAEFQERRRKLFKLVKSPNSYAWQFTGGYDSVQSSLKDLAEICAM